MRPMRQELPVSRKGALVCAFVAAAMLLGGGGSPSARPEIIVQLGFAVAAFLWFAWAMREDASYKPVPREILVIVAFLLGLPLLQLIPLPPALWQALPGREAQVAALAAIGEADSWRSLSIAPHVTFAALMALIPVVGSMLAVTQIGLRARTALLVTIVVVTLAGAALGVLQMAGGPDDFRIYERSHRGWLVAFHANRNAAADVFLIGSLAMTAWTMERVHRYGLSPTRLGILASVQAVLLAALLMTGSRAGIVLGLVVLSVNLAMMRRPGVVLDTKKLAMAGAGVLAMLAAGMAWLVTSTRVSQVAERFDTDSDFRSELWTDGWSAATSFFPFGSGIGSFPEAFLPHERLSVIDDLFPNRAHNDYLEFLIEAGILAPLVLALGAICLVLLLRRAWSAGGVARSHLYFAGGTLLVLALHSIVDYPLRNMALAVLGGVAVGILGAHAAPGPDTQDTGADE